MDSINENIVLKLDMIKEELDYIKENMVEREDILSSYEFDAYRRSFKKENLISFEDLKKELNL